MADKSKKTGASKGKAAVGKAKKAPEKITEKAMDVVEEGGSQLKKIVMSGLGAIVTGVEKAGEAIKDFAESDLAGELSEKGEQAFKTAVDAGSRAVEKVKEIVRPKPAEEVKDAGKPAAKELAAKKPAAKASTRKPAAATKKAPAKTSAAKPAAATKKEPVKTTSTKPATAKKAPATATTAKPAAAKKAPTKKSPTTKKDS